jgi:hypothetical protein
MIRMKNNIKNFYFTKKTEQYDTSVFEYTWLFNNILGNKK